MITKTDYETGSCCTVSPPGDRTTQPGIDAIREGGSTEAPNCCSPASPSADVGENTDIFEEISSEETPADVAAIRNAGFRLLLDAGAPVGVADLIAVTDVPAARVAEIFDSGRARGRAEFDDAGRLIGIAGLSLTPSSHELTIAGETRWTWCALDAVGILGALEATGTIRSIDPQTKDSIEIAFTDGTTDSNVHLFVLGGYTEGNVREDWCPRVNFFTSQHAAEEWVSAHGLEGDIVSVAEVAGEASAMWRPVVDLNASQGG